MLSVAIVGDLIIIFVCGAMILTLFRFLWTLSFASPKTVRLARLVHAQNGCAAKALKPYYDRGVGRGLVFNEKGDRIEVVARVSDSEIDSVLRITR